MRLDRRPQPRHVVAAHRGRRDLDQLDLIGQIGRGQSLECRRQHADVERARIERATDRSPVEHRPLMEEMHGIAEQYLGLEIDPAVGRQHVMQVERQRRVGQTVAADRAARRQPCILPALVGRHPVKEQVQSRRIVRLIEMDCVRGYRTDIYGGPHRRSRFDETIVEKVAENRADSSDRKRRTH
ncbi:hypothetical protein GALL_478970 [mine drainage metagenome]|uniref:Uncharacterized protein n=1 Tax=mine drainage metagenome TaxID=410659 RepID=A0A1J5PH03_9ZZZZ